MFDKTTRNLARVLIASRSYTTNSCALPLVGRWTGLRPLPGGKPALASAGAAL